MSKITKINVGGVDYELGGSGSAQVIETTYAQLKELVDASGLTPGNRYRITDFVSTFSAVQSANHPFDLIVTANTESTFFPKAQAILHEGDDYFAKCNLSKWEIWYDFSNNKTAYPLADSNGKGYIYRMIDEWNNDVNYDFKNLLVTVSANFFHSFGNSADDETTFYTFSFAKDSTKESLLAVSDMSVSKGQYCNNNYIKAQYEFANPFLNRSGISLGCCGGISQMVIQGIKNNHIEGETFLAFSYDSIGGAIIENVAYSSFSVRVMARMVAYNRIYGELSIGPTNYSDWTKGITIGTVNNNVSLSDMDIIGQDIDGLAVMNNIIKGRSSLVQKATIQNCEIIGSFASDGEGITEAQDGKLIVGKGETVSIIDPSTFYS